MLNESFGSILLKAARGAVTDRLLQTDTLPDIPDDPAALEKRGVFVTITKRGQLRGCIGYVTGVAPLWDSVVRMAGEAAFGDPRFAPVTEEEIDELTFEVSVLTPLEGPVDPGMGFKGYGIFIRNGYRSGLLLPQVAEEQGWDDVAFLRNTCMKAGLDPGCYNDAGTEIYRFRAQIFSEEKARG